MGQRTQSTQRTFEWHNKGKVESTKHRQPLELICFEACISREDAIRREKYVADFSCYYVANFNKILPRYLMKYRVYHE